MGEGMGWMGKMDKGAQNSQSSCKLVMGMKCSVENIANVSVTSLLTDSNCTSFWSCFGK